MDLAGLRSAVYLRLGVPEGDALLTPTVVNAAINEALHEIDSEQDWPWLQVAEPIMTVDGDETVTPGGTWLRTESLRIVGDVPLERLTFDEMHDRYPANVGATGRPVAFAIEKDEIFLRPIPDGVYELDHRFIAEQEDFDGDDDVPRMPPQFHPAIACLAAHVVLGRSREDGRAAAALNDYERWQKKMKRHRRRHKGPARIRTGW